LVADFDEIGFIKYAEVEVKTRYLFVFGECDLPEGTRLGGEIVAVQPIEFALIGLGKALIKIERDEKFKFVPKVQDFQKTPALLFGNRIGPRRGLVGGLTGVLLHASSAYRPRGRDCRPFEG